MAATKQTTLFRSFCITAIFIYNMRSWREAPLNEWSFGIHVQLDSSILVATPQALTSKGSGEYFRVRLYDSQGTSFVP
jgi:hypothetical protein